jgi:hypothetical protein
MSPVSLVRLLKSIAPSGVSMYVHMMTEQEFFDYKKPAAAGSYSQVGYSTVRELEYTAAEIHQIGVKRCYKQCTSEKFNVLKKVKLRNGAVKPLVNPKRQTKKPELSAAKKKDIESLLRFMSGDDLRYMKSVIS